MPLPALLPYKKSRANFRNFVVMAKLLLLWGIVALPTASALVPLLDGGKQMPKLYDGWMNDQIAKQASTGISNALAAGYEKIEVNFPPVPNLDEVCSTRGIGVAYLVD